MLLLRNSAIPPYLLLGPRQKIAYPMESWDGRCRVERQLVELMVMRGPPTFVRSVNGPRRRRDHAPKVGRRARRRSR